MSTSRSKSPAAVSALDAHLGYWLRLVSNHVSHAFKLQVETHGVTVAEWVVLRALYEHEGVKPTELADRLGLTRGAISKLTDRLVAKELIAVRDDAEDRRSLILRLRARGRAMVPVLAALADENDARAFAHLSRAQRTALRDTLRGLVDHLGIQGTAVE